MIKYAVLIFERERPGGLADIPPEILKAHEELPQRIAELGGREIGGLALEPGSTASSIRGGMVVEGPFVESDTTLAGVFVIEARSVEHALEIAQLTPVVDGGVEVRPLIGLEFATGD